MRSPTRVRVMECLMKVAKASSPMRTEGRALTSMRWH